MDQWDGKGFVKVQEPFVYEKYKNDVLVYT